MTKKTFAILALLLVAGSLRAQVPVTLGPAPQAQFLNNSGAPLAGGKVFTYQAGSAIAQPTYSDSTGLVQNANPVILNSSGRANIWFSALAYKIVVQTSTGVTLYTVDNFLVSPFLAANNSWIGNQTFAGTSIFNGPVTFSAGGAMSGNFTGSPTFSGNPTFSGTPVFPSIQAFPSGIKTDAITGTISSGAGGAVVISGLSAFGATHGEDVVINPGSGGPTGAGGVFNVTTGNGGATSGNGGNINLTTGSGQGGNGIGGAFVFTGGNSAGISAGGPFSLIGGIGGSTAGPGGFVLLKAGQGGAGGNGGDVNITPGTKGAGGQDGSMVIGQSGRIKFSVPGGVAPTCASTGIGATGTCVVDPNSTDTEGSVSFNVLGAGPAALGTFTLTFNQSMGANGSMCTAMLVNGSGSWSPRATIIGSSFASLNATFLWDNNAVALVAASNWRIAYNCVGRI